MISFPTGRSVVIRNSNLDQSRPLLQQHEMAQRQSSPTHDAPEAVPNQPQRSTFGYVGSDDYEYFEPPASALERNRSPVPEYQRYENGTSTTSPRISAASPPPPSSDIGRSPAMSDAGFSTTKRPLSPSVQYSEVHSPDPQMVYDQADKEAVYSSEPPRSKVPSYYAAPVPGNIQHHNSNENPQVFNNQPDHYNEKPQKKPFYKRWWFWLILLLVIVAIAVGVGCGVALGNKKHKSNPSPGGSSTNGTSGDNPDVDINAAVGGYINPAYYSKSGAWNGSGIAIAGANVVTDQSIYAFYQDYTGAIQQTLMTSEYTWQVVGPVNSGAPTALNGTPLSTVEHTLGAELVWHVFYIDEDYYIRERIITNTSTDGTIPVWKDGPLSSQNLKTWEADTIGMQACYWGNYYGEWSYNTTEVSAGIHLWFASDATVFQQYSWTNGTDKWTRDQQWPDLSGNAGVGCQTWDTGMTEYVWFVDTNGNIAMSWKDNNQTVNATAEHPVGQWTAGKQSH